MALTSPHYTNGASRCSIAVESINRGIQAQFALTADQTDTWTDEDLAARVNALAAAVKAFLVPGESLNVSAYWTGDARAEVLTIGEVIEYPAEEPVEEPAPEPGGEPAEEPTGDPTEDPDDPADEPTPDQGQ